MGFGLVSPGLFDRFDSFSICRPPERLKESKTRTGLGRDRENTAFGLTLGKVPNLRLIRPAQEPVDGASISGIAHQL